MSVTLIGFIAELRGNEDNLISGEPVVEIDGQQYVAHGRSWTLESLEFLSPDQSAYVRDFRDTETCPIEPGDVVWLAGSNFVADVQNFPTLREFAADLKINWKLSSQGFKWRLGSQADLDDLLVQQANRVEIQLHQLLFDRLEKSHGESNRAFRMYSVLNVVESANRLINRGLYYFEIRDEYGFQLVCHQSASSSFFDSIAEFETAVEQRRTSLRRARLDEATPDPHPLSATSWTALEGSNLGTFEQAWRRYVDAAIATRTRMLPLQLSRTNADPFDFGAGS